MIKFIAIAVLITYVTAENASAIVKITGEATGSVTFVESDKGLQITGEIAGLTPGKHGFHIHQKGDIVKDCLSTGGHFNPYNKKHGAQNATERHAGDLGNIVADANGVAKIALVDSMISLSGVTSILGRAVVVHAGEDDLGLGGHEDSLTTGHAGGRVGCGVIGIL